MSQTNFREIAPAVLFDTSGRLLLQLRDNIPNILYPGKIGLFGGHREGSETFLECVVREIREELSFYLPPERFQTIASRSGPDSEVPGGTVRAEIFVARDVPVAEIKVTEGSLKIVPTSEVSQIESALTPYAKVALVSLGLLPAFPSDQGALKGS
jgi:8-oxo-dGTP diphosphatase